jgi:hypothetical protein
MSRNTLAGSKVGKSKTAQFYQKNSEARKKKLAYDAEYNKKPSRKKYRSILNAINHKNGTYGNLDRLDYSHTKDGKLVKEAQSKNRARNGHNGKSTKK